MSRDGISGATLTSEEAKVARARLRFVELVAEGCPQSMAGQEVGWSWLRTKRELASPDFFELVEGAIDRADDAIEGVLYKMARKGNMAAVQMWLFNRRPDSWRDVKRIEVQTESKVSIHVIDAVKQSALELLRDVGVGPMREISGAIAADAIEVTGHDD